MAWVSVVSPLPDGPLFLLIQSLNEPKQFLKSLLNDPAVFLAVVRRHNLFIMGLKICSQGVFVQHPPEAGFNGLFEILDGRVPGFAHRKFLFQAVKVNAADVIGLSFSYPRSRFGGDDSLVHHFMKLADDLTDISLLTVLPEASVNDVYGIPPLPEICSRPRC